MGITKQLTKHGNSFALIIDKAVLELIGIDKDTLIEISSPDGLSLLLTPIGNSDHKKKFKRSLNKINKKYKKTLKKLA
jgi:antitoxin component of MazEF toxin-antitoxin module